MDVIDQLVGGKTRRDLILTPKEENEIYWRMRDGDQESRDRLIASQILWAARLAILRAGRGIPFDDLLQEAILAVLECLESFDPTKGRLSNYAFRSINWKLNKLLDEWWHNAPGDPNVAVDAALDDGASADEIVEQVERDRIINALLAQCKNRLGAKILNRVALGETLATIAESMGISPQRVWQIKEIALSQLDMSKLAAVA